MLFGNTQLNSEPGCKLGSNEAEAEQSSKTECIYIQRKIQVLLFLLFPLGSCV